jgi:hypothetical protein
MLTATTAWYLSLIMRCVGCFLYSTPHGLYENTKTARKWRYRAMLLQPSPKSVQQNWAKLHRRSLLGCNDAQSGKRTSYTQVVGVSGTHRGMLCLWIRTVYLLTTDTLTNRQVINKTGKLQFVPQCISKHFFEYVCAFHIMQFPDCFYFVTVDTVVNITNMVFIFNNVPASWW